MTKYFYFAQNNVWIMVLVIQTFMCIFHFTFEAIYFVGKTTDFRHIKEACTTEHWVILNAHSDGLILGGFVYKFVACLLRSWCSSALHKVCVMCCHISRCFFSYVATVLQRMTPILY